tara:strand:+ start:720 stop:2198 length:1479 start_codon:yes stop_codon:yes gene_type:complete
MTSLSTLFGGGDTGAAAAQDPLQEGYPVIAVYGGNFNTYFDLRLHRVHTGEVLGSPWGTANNSTNDYYSGQQNMHMFGYNSDYGRLNSGYSSHNYNSHESYSMSIMQHDHYPYSFYGSCSKDGRMGMQSFHGNDYYQKYYRRINVISKSGRRPRRQFNINNTKFTETSMQSMYGLKSSLDLSSNGYNDYMAGQNPGSTNNYGSACYNQKTKTMCIYWADSNGSDNGKMYIYRGTKDLMSEVECPTVKDWFDSCKTGSGSIIWRKVNSVTNWGYSSLNYNVNLVMGDNDWVGVNTRYDNNNRYGAFDCTTTVNQNSAVTSYSSTRGEGNTTSYGPEQGMMHRARMMLTWDTEWAALYSPYYYYGCGSSTWLVSTKNPRKMAYYGWSESNYGGIFTPSGKSGFKLLYGQNTDSNPIQNWGIELGNTTTDHTQNFNYYSGQDNYSDNERAVSNWTGTVTNSMSNYSFQYPGYYYSTSYPRFMTVNWWDTEGGYLQ